MQAPKSQLDQAVAAFEQATPVALAVAEAPSLDFEAVAERTVVVQPESQPVQPPATPPVQEVTQHLFESLEPVPEEVGDETSTVVEETTLPPSQIQTSPREERKVSALSLSSIRARKEMESSLEKKVVNPDDLPKEPFTEEQFMEEWTKYADKLARSGFMLMSSLMGMVPPIIKGTAVSLEMPNEGSKLSFDENKFDLVNYLRKKLSNYDLEIEIIVNEEVRIQKRVLDKEDKLVRFVELNPAMQYMKEIFDLEFK